MKGLKPFKRIGFRRRTLTYLLVISAALGFLILSIYYPKTLPRRQDVLTKYSFNKDLAAATMFNVSATSMVLSQTTEPGHHNAMPSFTAVIIIAYMRTGSSLTGDILQHSPGAFYLYEPLRLLHHLLEVPGSNLTYLDGTVREGPFNFYEEAVTMLRKWLVCDLEHLPLISFQDSFLEFGLGNKNYRACFDKWKLIFKSNPTKVILSCLSELKTNCEQASLRIIKTIRTPIKQVSNFMEEFPGLKIVHLVRDPRATLWSQGAVGKCKEKYGGHYGCTNEFCTRLENDTMEFDALSERYPGRLKTVFYENIAFYPIETSKEMYGFIGTTFTREAEEYIYNITLAGNPNGCVICSSRTNSSEHAVKWKTNMSKTFVNIIEDRCKGIMKHYNFTLSVS